MLAQSSPPRLAAPHQATAAPAAVVQADSKTTDSKKPAKDKLIPHGTQGKQSHIKLGVSAHPFRYAQWETQAADIVAEHWNNS